MVGEAAEIIGEATRIADEVTWMIEVTPKAPHEDAGIANKDAEKVEVGYGTIMAMDQATSRVHGASVRLAMAIVGM